MALICITLSVFYFFFAEGRSAFKDTFFGKGSSEVGGDVLLADDPKQKKMDNDDDFEAA